MLRIASDWQRLWRIATARRSMSARIILATGEGCGTAEIMRRAGVSKPCVWRWQERFMREGVAGLLRDKNLLAISVSQREQRTSVPKE